MKTTKAGILVVDGEKENRVMLSELLRNEGYHTVGVSGGSLALKALENEPFDLVLVDIRLRDIDGIAAMMEIRKTNPFVPVVMMAENASLRDVVNALKLGAYDYLAKPVDLQEVKIVIEQAMKYYGLRKEKDLVKKGASEKFGFGNIIGDSPAMKELFETLSLVAPCWVFRRSWPPAMIESGHPL